VRHRKFLAATLAVPALVGLWFAFGRTTGGSGEGCGDIGWFSLSPDGGVVVGLVVADEPYRD